MLKNLNTFIYACLMATLLVACGEDGENTSTSDTGHEGHDTSGSTSGDSSGSTSGGDSSGSTSGSDDTSGGSSGGDTSGSTSGDTSGSVTVDCTEIPTEANLGDNCAQPSECSASVCLAETQGGQGTCRQPCVFQACEDMCATGEVCLPLADQSGNPIPYPGTTDKYIGACGVPAALECSEIPTVSSAQLGQACSTTDASTCEGGACLVSQQGATNGICGQLCSPGTCEEMCNGKACQSAGQNFPDGSPVGFCQP